MNSEDFAKRMRVLAEVLPSQHKTMTDARIEIYFIALKDIESGALDQAFKTALRTCKFFPAIAELRDLAGYGLADSQVSIESKALQAWSVVRDAMDRYDYGRSVDFGGTANAAIDNLGGWVRLCGLPQDELDKWTRKDFLRVYAAYEQSGVVGPPYLMGQLEQDNRDKGYWPPEPGDPYNLMLSCSTVRVDMLALGGDKVLALDEHPKDANSDFWGIERHMLGTGGLPPTRDNRGE